VHRRGSNAVIVEPEAPAFERGAGALVRVVVPVEGQVDLDDWWDLKRRGSDGLGSFRNAALPTQCIALHTQPRPHPPDPPHPHPHLVIIHELLQRIPRLGRGRLVAVGPPVVGGCDVQRPVARHDQPGGEGAVDGFELLGDEVVLLGAWVRLVSVGVSLGFADCVRLGIEA
jgi:hypothetical protein